MIFEEHLRPEAFRILSDRNLERQHTFMLDTTELAIHHLPRATLFGTYICEMNAIATAGLCSSAGRYRTDTASINNSDHIPPSWQRVEDLVGDLCVSVKTHWDTTSAFDLASYIIWRLTWIHPFADGNGRTADAVGYSILCRKLGLILPGDNPVPSYWHANRDTRYYQALAAADRQEPNLPEGPVELRELLKRAVLNQLNSVPWRDKSLPSPL